MPRLNLQMFHGPCLFLIYTLPHSRIVSCQEKQQENATAAQRPTKCARKRWPSRQKKIRRKGSCSCRQTAWPAESDSNAQLQKRVPLACRSFRYVNKSPRSLEPQAASYVLAFGLAVAKNSSGFHEAAYKTCHASSGPGLTRRFAFKQIDVKAAPQCKASFGFEKLWKEVAITKLIVDRHNI